MSNAIDVFAQPGRIGELKHLLEVQAAEIAIAERYVENARYLTNGNPVNNYRLALCSDFINAAMDNDGFYGELCLLTLDQLAFVSISFATSHLDKLKQYFKASSIQTYFSTQQHLIGHQQLDQITKRLRKYAKKHTKFQVLLVARNDQSIRKGERGNRLIGWYLRYEGLEVLDQCYSGVVDGHQFQGSECMYFACFGYDLTWADHNVSKYETIRISSFLDHL